MQRPRSLSFLLNQSSSLHRVIKLCLTFYCCRKEEIDKMKKEETEKTTRVQELERLRAERKKMEADRKTREEDAAAAEKRAQKLREQEKKDAEDAARQQALAARAVRHFHIILYPSIYRLSLSISEHEVSLNKRIDGTKSGSFRKKIAKLRRGEKLN